MTERGSRSASGCAVIALGAGVAGGVLVAVILTGDVASDPAQGAVQTMTNTVLLMALVPASAVLTISGGIAVGRALVAPSAPRTRPRSIAVAAVLVGIAGASGIALASLMLLGSVGETVTLAVNAGLGAGWLVAANGIWAVERWGRTGGIVLCVAGIALALAGQALIWTLVPAVPSLWILVRHWPAEP